MKFRLLEEKLLNKTIFSNFSSHNTRCKQTLTVLLPLWLYKFQTAQFSLIDYRKPVRILSAHHRWRLLYVCLFSFPCLFYINWFSRAYNWKILGCAQDVLIMINKKNKCHICVFFMLFYQYFYKVLTNTQFKWTKPIFSMLFLILYMN